MQTAAVKAGETENKSKMENINPNLWDHFTCERIKPSNKNSETESRF
jgi:hypothetical protein